MKRSIMFKGIVSVIALVFVTASCGFYFFTPPPRANPFDEEYNADTGSFSGTVSLFGGGSPSSVTTTAELVRNTGGDPISDGPEFALTISDEGVISGSVPLGTYDVTLSYPPYYDVEIIGKQIHDAGEEASLGDITLTLLHEILPESGYKWGLDPSSETVYYNYDTSGVMSVGSLPDGPTENQVSDENINSRIGVSPDGTKLLFKKQISASQTDLMILDLNNPDAGPTTLLEFYEGVFAWNPDGRWVAVVDEDGPNWRVYEIDTTGEASDREIHTTSGDNEYYYGELCYSTLDDVTRILLLEDGNIISAEFDGSAWKSPVTLVSAYELRKAGISSPYVYYRPSYEDYEIWKVPVDGTVAGELFLDVGDDFDLSSVSPAGNYLIYGIGGMNYSYTVVDTSDNSEVSLPCPGQSYGDITWNSAEDMIIANITDSSGMSLSQSLVSVKMEEGFTLP